MTRAHTHSLPALAAIAIAAVFGCGLALSVVEAQEPTLTRATHGDTGSAERAAAERLLGRLGYRDAEGVRRRGEMMVVEATDRFGVRRRLVLSLSEGIVVGEQALPRAEQR
jgi:hypothetical protein